MTTYAVLCNRLQRRRPNPTVAPREVKLRCWFFVAGGRFLLHNVAIFCKLHRVFAIHRCINEGYGLRQIFTEQNTDFPHEIVACLYVQTKQNNNVESKMIITFSLSVEVECNCT